MATHGFQYVERAMDICINVGSDRPVGIRYSDQRREVENGIACPDGVVDHAGIANVAHQYFKPIADVRAAMIQPAPGVEGIVVHQCPDLMSGTNEEFAQVGTDKSIGAGDQNFFPCRNGGISFQKFNRKNFSTLPHSG